MFVIVEYNSPRNGEKITKNFNNGESVYCDASTFGRNIDSGTKKVCKVNGYIVAKEGETFKANPNVKQHKYCHGSTIPYDLTGNANATVNITTWGGVTLNKDTFRTTVEPINGIAQQSKSDSGNEAKGTVVCQSNGTWKLGSGYHNMVTVGAHSFVVINGAKKSNKQFTIELWGGQGGSTTLNVSGGKGGYTKLVSQLGNKFNEGTVLYVGVAGQGDGYNGGYNGGGSVTLRVEGGGGGGATHLATKSGLLSSLSGSKSSVIAVAGGGGGLSGGGSHEGGAGGGANMNGGDGECGSLFCNTPPKGGALTPEDSGGYFGLGRDYGGMFNSGAGGGGYYGGGAGGQYSGGGGGSGYCNGSYGSCSGSSGSRSGNGYAKITW